MITTERSPEEGSRLSIDADPPATTLQRVARQVGRPWVLAALYALVLFVAGLALHPIMAMWCEVDDYVGQARLLSEGGWPYDIFHPLGYPALAAPLGILFGDYFLAARMISALSAGLLVWSTYHLARASFSHASGVLAALLVAVHPQVIVDGFQATSDMLAAAMVALVLYLNARVVRGPRLRDASYLGFAFGLAYWARYPALALLVAILPALLLPSRHAGRNRTQPPRRDDARLGPLESSRPATIHPSRGPAEPTLAQRLRRLLAFGLGGAIGLVPHCVMTRAQWGTWFHDENWRNLAMRHFGTVEGWPDFNYLHQAPFDSWLSVIRHDPGLLVRQSLEASERLFWRDLPAYLTGNPASPGRVEWLLYILIPVGCLAALLVRRPGIPLGVLFAVCYLLATSVTFYVDPRIALIGLAPLLGASSSLLWFSSRLCRRLPRVGKTLQAAIGLALVGYVGSHTPARVNWLASREPHAELRVIRDLVAEHGSEVRIATTMGVLMHHADFQCRWITRHYGATFPADQYAEQIAREVAANGVDFVVLGGVTLDGADRLTALSAMAPPAGLVPVEGFPDALVWRVVSPEVRCIPNPCMGGPLRIEVDPTIPFEQISSVGLLATDPSGVQHEIPTLPVGEGMASMTIPSDGIPKGQWQIRARLETPRGFIIGPATSLEIR